MTIHRPQDVLCAPFCSNCKYPCEYAASGCGVPIKPANRCIVRHAAERTQPAHLVGEPLQRGRTLDQGAPSVKQCRVRAQHCASGPGRERGYPSNCAFATGQGSGQSKRAVICFSRRRCTEEGMRRASRYLATVRRAMSIPSRLSCSTILSSESTALAGSASMRIALVVRKMSRTDIDEIAGHAVRQCLDAVAEGIGRQDLVLGREDGELGFAREADEARDRLYARRYACSLQLERRYTPPCEQRWASLQAGTASSRRYGAHACGYCRPKVPTRICCSDMALPPFQYNPGAASRLHAQRIGWPARVSPALEHTALLVGDNRAYRSGKPCPLRPPFDLVAEAARVPLRSDGRCGLPD